MESSCRASAHVAIRSSYPPRAASLAPSITPAKLYFGVEFSTPIRRRFRIRIDQLLEVLGRRRVSTVGFHMRTA